MLPAGPLFSSLPSPSRIYSPPLWACGLLPRFSAAHLPGRGQLGASLHLAWLVSCFGEKSNRCWSPASVCSIAPAQSCLSVVRLQGLSALENWRKLCPLGSWHLPSSRCPPHQSPDNGKSFPVGGSGTGFCVLALLLQNCNKRKCRTTAFWLAAPASKSSARQKYQLMAFPRLLPHNDK